MIADHRRDDSLEGIAGRLLRDAPPRFALVGLSMGGRIAFEVLRQDPQRVSKLVLLGTSARVDRIETPERNALRSRQIELARAGQMREVADTMLAQLVSRNDEQLRQLIYLIAEEIGPDAFIRQRNA